MCNSAAKRQALRWGGARHLATRSATLCPSTRSELNSFFVFMVCLFLLPVIFSDFFGALGSSHTTELFRSG